MGDPGTALEAVATAIPTAKHTVFSGAIFQKNELSGYVKGREGEGMDEVAREAGKMDRRERLEERD